MTGTPPDTRTWIIDSGASEHITCDITNLFNVSTHSSEPAVRIPNGELVPVSAVGSLYLSNGFHLRRVLFIPQFQCNLLSASRLTGDLNCTLTFFSDFCIFQDLPSRKLIGKGGFYNGLYYLELPIGERVAMRATLDSNLWHRRLGHASNGKLRHISFLKGLQQNSSFCDPCLRAKQTRLPFPNSTSKSTCCFELIHCDIWGSYRCDSTSGARYFLSIVDDFSRGVWVYLMKSKSEVCQKLIHFCNMIETQFEKRVKRIRSDNGMEFQTNILSEFYGRRGIILETSCTDTPQQNGVVERKHRHILEVARAFRFQSGLPIDFWGECILTAVYIINRLPSPVILNKSPYEILFGKEPYYEHLRVFGCLVYAHDNKRKDKFGERGSPCVFLGYPNGQKAYRVFDLQRQNIYSSRDVTFIENEFPFKMINHEGHDFADIVDRAYKEIVCRSSTVSHGDHRTRSSGEHPGRTHDHRAAVYQPEHLPLISVEPDNHLEEVCGSTPVCRSSDEPDMRSSLHRNGAETKVGPTPRHLSSTEQQPHSNGDNPGKGSITGRGSEGTHAGPSSHPLLATEQFPPDTFLDGHETNTQTHSRSMHPTQVNLPPGPNEQMNGEKTVEPHLRSHPRDITSSTDDIRRGNRLRLLPKHFTEYDVDLPPSLVHSQPTTNQADSIMYPISNFITYERFSNKHKAFLAAITSHDEPKQFSQAILVPMWRQAMQREIHALEENGTWTLVQLPPGKKVVDSKWVYKIKYKPNGDVERYKARLVAKGFTQVEGIDFHETFAPVAKLVTVRCLLAVAAKRNWEVHQLDVNNAFLHGDLLEEVYMRIPQGFRKGGDTRVCKLQKSIYGLRQASRNWYHKFTQSLLAVGFRQSRSDHSLFIFQQGKNHTFALIYVDDVILAGNDASHITRIKGYLNDQFSIKDLGTLKYFLGIEVARSPEGFVLSQRKYTLDILKESGLLAGRPSQFPMEQNLKLRPDDDSPLVDASSYRRLIGRLLYLTVTRPDIVFSVSQLSQFLSQPRQSHFDAAIRVLRYLKQTPGQGIFLSADNDFSLKGYCDADWAGCSYTRRSSTGGRRNSLGNSPVSWRTKKQSVVSRSSAEAEYRAMAVTVSEILWLRWLLHDLTVPQTGPTSLFCDNQAARHIALNPVFHERTKHVEMDCYFVRERVASGEIQPCCISTTHQIADIFTKALGTDRFQFLKSKLGVRNLHTPP
ncbi:unnamed protein product [Cuscuta epithymum]|uniref:Integrase catalytic domain-containing protein n=1 Tax=Cuscuta epithymum TaxID=186058 RepID=A0AAV0FSD2_9ASTE|nr:unnamed protein product [Cuscuta epithymum]